MGKYIRMAVFIGLAVVCIILVIWGFNQSKRIGDITGEKTTLDESLQQSLDKVSDLERLLSVRELRSKEDERTIADLQSNLRKSEEHNKQLESDINRLGTANREFERLEQERNRRTEEGERVFEEFRRELERLKEEIEKIPVVAVD